MSGTAVDWEQVKLPGVAPRARPRARVWYPIECPHGYDACPRCDADVLTPPVVLDATRVIYRALKIHHTTARMAALALYHAGLLK